MKKLLVPVIIALVFAACNPKTQTANVDLAKEKQAVQLVIDNYLKAFTAKDSVGIMKLFAGEETVVYCNCDTIPLKGLKAIDENLKKCFKSCKSCKMEAAVNPNINISVDASLANAIFDVPSECSMEGMEACKMTHTMAFTLTKVGADWKILNTLMTKKGGRKCGGDKCGDMKDCKDGKMAGCKDGKTPECNGGAKAGCGSGAKNGCPGEAKSVCPKAKMK
jgi:ketosteroid isomerase-like protein